jgi:hypothetical protein
MKKLHKDRLLKLAEHLEKGKLGHKIFAFQVFNYSPVGEFDGKGCGTMGCAIGECPFVFPKYWKFVDSGVRNERVPILKTAKSNAPFYSVEEFFGINGREYDHLFAPLMQQPTLFSGKELGYEAAPEEVASNIREFVKRKEKKLC